MKDQTLYLECSASVSGDMTLAALIDLGADIKLLLKGLESLNVVGYSVKISNNIKNGINAIDFNVVLSDIELTGNQLFIERNIDDIYCIINNLSISENAMTI